MANEDNNKSDQFNASLHLPDDSAQPVHDDTNHAADLIRKKVQSAYTDEPDVEDETQEVKSLGSTQRSKHQQFIYELTNSGRPLHEINTAWHEYYAGLTDSEKHLVWQEFYTSHAQSAHHPAITHSESDVQPAAPFHKKTRHKVVERTIKQVKPKLIEKAPRQTRPHHKKKANPLHSLLFGLGIGSLTILIFLFGFFNERIIAPFIQPSRNVTNIPIITTDSVSSEPLVVIPKINVEIPVVYDVNTVNESSIEKGLESGVVHYADTADPGQNGNVVIVGHSSNNILNPGKYKFAFTLLHDLQPGDTFYLQKDGKRYTYQVYKRVIVKPEDVSVLGLSEKTATATLITCDPPGTSNNRLVITGEQISPDPSGNIAASSQNQLASSAAIVPGNSPTLWSRMVKWFTQ